MQLQPLLPLFLPLLPLVLPVHLHRQLLSLRLLLLQQGWLLLLRLLMSQLRQPVLTLHIWKEVLHEQTEVLLLLLLLPPLLHCCCWLVWGLLLQLLPLVRQPPG